MGFLGLAASLAAGFFLWIDVKQAHAYIDVGTATFLFQILAALAIGALFTLKLFWQRIFKGVSRLMIRNKGTKGTS